MRIWIAPEQRNVGSRRSLTSVTGRCLREGVISMGIGDICRRDVITIAPDASLGFAAHLMREKHVGMLVVVGPASEHGDRVVQGVLTDRDIVLTVVGRDAEPKDFK